MADQEYYSASEAAKYLNVSLETLKHWVRQDKFPCLTRPERWYSVKNP